MGLLAAVDMPAGVDTVVYTVPVGKTSSFTVSMCNRTSAAVRVRLALTDGSATSAKNYIEYTDIPANDSLERSGVVLSASDTVTAYAASSGISTVIWGVEE